MNLIFCYIKIRLDVICYQLLGLVKFKSKLYLIQLKSPVEAFFAQLGFKKGVITLGKP